VFAPRSRGPHHLVALGALVFAFALVAAVVARHATRGSADATVGSAPAAGRPPGRLAQAQAITLNWVGDIALSSERGLPPNGLESALAPVSALLHDADLSIGNLEGTLASGGASKCGVRPARACFAFQAPPAVAGQLREAGFGLVNQANNHSLDYGESGRAQTLAALQQYGLPYTGLPGQITTLSIRGIRVAFVGFAPYSYDANLLDLPGAAALIKQARVQAQVVVVIIHAGAEGATETRTPYGEESFLGEDRGDARAFAHAAVDAGASLVLGSGPHVPRGVEDYHGHLIAYSLGNFVGYHTLGSGGALSQSAILHVTLGSAGTLLAARWTSLAMEDGVPRTDPANASARLVSTLSAQDFPTDHFVIDADGAFHF
jgi:hypothetical protein